MPPVQFRLLLVTDRHQARQPSLLVAVDEALAGGVQAVQLRERDLPTRELLTLAQEIHLCAVQRAVPLIVNDRLDVALALNLEGVHLRADSLPVQVARRLLGAHRLIGVSTHSTEEVQRANDEGADYVVLGPVFETPSKRTFGPPLGLQVLEDACRQSRVPVFAIGGVTRDRVPELVRCGASGIAVIGAILACDDVTAAAYELAVASASARMF